MTETMTEMGGGTTVAKIAVKGGAVILAKSGATTAVIRDRMIGLKSNARPAKSGATTELIVRMTGALTAENNIGTNADLAPAACLRTSVVTAATSDRMITDQVAVTRVAMSGVMKGNTTGGIRPVATSVPTREG